MSWTICTHMDYLNNVFTTFLGLESCNDITINGGTESSQIS